MSKKKPKTKYKFFFKIPIADILKEWLEKGDLTEDEIAKKNEVREFMVISNHKENGRENES